MGLKESGLRGSLRSVSTSVIAIPDSAILHIDATQDGRTSGSITSIPDQDGSLDLSGSAELVDNGPNGERSYRFDGVDDAMDVAFSSVSQPFTLITVVDPATTDTQVHTSGRDGDIAHLSFNNPEHGVHFGDFTNTGINADAEPQIVIGVIDGSNSRLRVNGEQIWSGNPGSNPLDGFRIANDVNLNNAMEGDIPESLPCDGVLPESTIEQQENRLSDKYAIALV